MKMHLYASNTNTNTQNTHIKYKIQTHTNTNMTIGSLSQIGGGKKLDFLKKCSHENGRNFCSRINSKARRVPK